MSRAAVICAAALFATAAFAEQPLPVYPGTVHTRIGNDLMIGGEYYRLAYFTTNDDIPTVANYFHKHYSDQGYPVFVDGDAEAGELVVTAFYTREGLARSVVLRGHDGKTLGFSVLKDLWNRQDESKGAGAAALVPLEGALLTQDFAYDDGQGRARQRTQVVQGQLTAIRADLVKRMGLNGFTLSRETGTKLDGKPAIVLELNRRGQQVITSLAQVDDQMVGVYQTWIGSDRPDAVPNDRAVEKLREQMAKEKGLKK